MKRETEKKLAEQKLAVEKGTLRLSVVSALIGFLLGGGGVFGLVQWLDSRAVNKASAELDASNKKYESIDKLDARRAHLEQELADLKENNRQKSEFLQQELASVLADLEQLRSVPGLPDWAKDKMKADQERLRKAQVQP